METPIDFVEAMRPLGVALAIGLLVGIQRGYAQHQEREQQFGGTRTFGLIGLLGGLVAMLAQVAAEPFLLFAGILAVTAFLATSYWAAASEGEIGLTSEFAAVVTFAAGVIAGYGQLLVAAAIGVVTATLLAAKPFTGRFTAALDERDITATVKFLVLAALLLPLLPDETYGPSPWNAVSPFKVGLMIVFISGLGFFGYVLIQLVGAGRGIGITGILGGLVSSTAVTLTFAERSRDSSRLSGMLGLGVLMAWTIMYARVLVEVGVVNFELLPEVLLPIGVGGVVAGAWAGYLFYKSRSEDSSSEGGETTFSNPFELGPAIQFGLLYGVILIGSKALSEWLGDTGVYLGAIASGLTDVDAITLSLSELSRGDGSISDTTAANGIVLAAASNTLVKAGIVWAAGSGAIRTAILPGAIGAVIASVALAFLF